MSSLSIEPLVSSADLYNKNTTIAKESCRRGLTPKNAPGCIKILNQWLNDVLRETFPRNVDINDDIYPIESSYLYYKYSNLFHNETVIDLSGLFLRDDLHEKIKKLRLNNKFLMTVLLSNLENLQIIEQNNLGAIFQQTLSPPKKLKEDINDYNTWVENFQKARHHDKKAQDQLKDDENYLEVTFNILCSSFEDITITNNFDFTFLGKLLDNEPTTPTKVSPNNSPNASPYSQYSQEYSSRTSSPLNPHDRFDSSSRTSSPSHSPRNSQSSISQKRDSYIKNTFEFFRGTQWKYQALELPQVIKIFEGLNKINNHAIEVNKIITKLKDSKDLKKRYFMLSANFKTSSYKIKR
jgi:hypothetical protein